MCNGINYWRKYCKPMIPVPPYAVVCDGGQSPRQAAAKEVRTTATARQPVQPGTSHLERISYVGDVLMSWLCLSFSVRWVVWQQLISFVHRKRAAFLSMGIFNITNQNWKTTRTPKQGSPLPRLLTLINGSTKTREITLPEMVRKSESLRCGACPVV